MSRAISLNFKPPGPVAGAYLRSQARVAGCMGPIGGGKTSTSFMKGLGFAQRQRRSTSDGIRRFKLCVVRDSYRRLWRSTIKTWWHWMPKEIGTWVGGDEQPASHTIEIQLGREDYLEFVVEFIAIGSDNIEDVLRGYEPTAFFLNESDRLAPEVLPYCIGRAGRYPDTDRHGGPTWWGVFMDYNAPDEDNYLFDMMMNRPEGHEFFIQPSGLSPDAENLQNLPGGAGYYIERARGQPEWYVRRMIENKFGYSRAGKPVFPEFNDQFHVARMELEPIKGLPVLLGLDAGMTPAATFRQRRPNGQWLVLDELATDIGAGVGPERFGEMVNLRMAERFPRFEAKGWADPSAAYGADKEDGKDDWIRIVSKVTGIPIVPAQTNKLIPRHEAIRRTLVGNIDGRHPRLLISPRCKHLRRAYNSGYRYRRMRLIGEERYRPEPEKNMFSHIADADQYVALGGGEYEAVMHRQEQRAQAIRQTHAATEDHPTGRWSDPGGRQGYAITE